MKDATTSTETAIKTLHILKEFGVQLSIDDFGTGYSSLSYLKRLSLDKLKIDQSFVRDLAEDQDNQEIVRAIVQLGHILKMGIIAEGVETREQMERLREFGCDQVQGYLISKPLPPDEIPALLARQAS
jgi:EAL domain-containing protein (putative c-di-GMP-specific phosphodiesterase class I)